MKIEFAATLPVADALVIPVQKNGLDTAVGGRTGHEVLAAAAAAARFEGEAGSIAEAFVGAGGAVNRILLLGVGDGSETDWERAGGAVTARLLTNAISAAIDLGAVAPSPAAVGRFAGALAQRAWRIDTYRTKLPEKQKPTFAQATIVGAPDGTDAAWQHNLAVTGGLDLTRTLVAEPPNVVYPETFVERVLKSVEGLGLEVTVLGPDQMAELGMGALLGVAQGSVREGRLLALKWSGKGAGDPDLALVGKGVTFDTGGISLKPGPGMEDMKWDMGGAGAVVGAMKALATRKAKANVIGVCGLVENMPDGNAIRPGDILTSMSGQTIEVLNTDAEGRLVLCDCVTWVQRTHHPKAIVDLATLTGACVVALGKVAHGLMSKHDDLSSELLGAGEHVYDRAWRLPLWDEYQTQLESAFADFANIGGKYAGAITAGCFLSRFTEGQRWAHLDIAGTSWDEGKKGLASGRPVGMLCQWLLDRAGAA